MIAIDNSQVVREVDPRTSRDVLVLLGVVALLVLGLVLYAWPHFEFRQAGRAALTLQRERERLIEQNRKLRLEKASLEDLGRVEALAVRHLGLIPPPADRVVVVERPKPAPAGTRQARGEDGVAARN